MLAMLAVNIGTNQYLSKVDGETTAAIMHQDDLITVAAQWQVITQRNSAMGYARGFSSDKEASDYFKSALKEYIKESSEIQKYLVANATTDADKRVLEEIGRQRTSVLASTKKMGDMHESGMSGLGDVLKNEMIPTTKRYMDAIDAFVKLQKTKRDEALAQAEHARAVSMWIGIAATGIVFLIGMAFAATLVRAITQPLERVVKVAERWRKASRPAI
jgi:hypothetical protein